LIRVVIRSTSLSRVQAQSTAGIKDPQAIRDFARTLLRSPASFRLFRPIVGDMPDGAREMAPAKDAVWLQRSLPDEA
jgi:hypothetical protein